MLPAGVIVTILVTFVLYFWFDANFWSLSSFYILGIIAGKLDYFKIPFKNLFGQK